MKNSERKLEKLFSNSPEMYKTKKTFINLLNYIDKQDWMGACHASTAIMYILLMEQGIKVKPCIGEVSKLSIIFDHSWIEYDGKIIDAAISNTLIQGLKFPPVFLDIDLGTEEETEFEYGSSCGKGIDPLAETISRMTLGEYMDNFSGHPQGLWGIAKELAKKQSLRLNVKKAKSQYGDTEWVLKS